MREARIAVAVAWVAGAAILAAQPRAARGGADTAGPDLRAFTGFEDWEWVRDSALLETKLRLARSWGYRQFLYGMNAPAPADAAGDSNWILGAETGWRWRLSDGGRAGRARARSRLMAEVRRVRGACSRAGLDFIPMFGPFGWGGRVPDIDPGAGAGVWYDIEAPAGTGNYLAPPDQGGIVSARDDWGPRRSPALAVERPGPSAFSIRLPWAGMRAEHFALDPPWDAYLVATFRLRSSRARGDSAALRAYEFNGAAFHPFSTKLVAGSLRSLSDSPGVFSLGFLVKGGRRYFLDVEYRAGAALGGKITCEGGELRRAAPPESLAVDETRDEVPRPGLPGGLRAYRESHGYPGEARWSTWIYGQSRGDSLRPFAAPPAARRVAWSRLRRVRGIFRSTKAEAASRDPVDPLSPAALQITQAVVDAIAEALGGEPAYFHLAGDETFTFPGPRRPSGPPDSAGRGEMLAEVLRIRMDSVRAAFRRRYPAEAAEITFLAYADMFGYLNGLAEGTMAGGGRLATLASGPRKLVMMPWYYAGHIRGLSGWYGKAGFSDGDALGAFAALLSREASEWKAMGMGFAGMYATDGDASLPDKLAGARIWAKVCSEYAVSGAGGGCRGFAYCAWTPSARWAGEYAGMPALAHFAWSGAGEGEAEALERGAAPASRR